jgi:hypothetical protein
MRVDWLAAPLERGSPTAGARVQDEAVVPARARANHARVTAHGRAHDHERKVGQTDEKNCAKNCAGAHQRRPALPA